MTSNPSHLLLFARCVYVSTLAQIVLLSYSASGIPTKHLDSLLEQRPFRSSYDELLRSEPKFQPAANETLEDRVRRIRNLAERGDPMAEFGLALLYVKGFGVPKNSSEAAKWCRKAAES